MPLVIWTSVYKNNFLCIEKFQNYSEDQQQLKKKQLNNHHKKTEQMNTEMR